MRKNLKDSLYFLVKVIFILSLLIFIINVKAFSQQGSRCGDIDGDLAITLLDWVIIMDHLFINHPALPNPDYSNVDGYGLVTVRDAAFICSYIYYMTPELGEACPLNDYHYFTYNELQDTFFIELPVLPSGDSIVTVRVIYENTDSIFLFAVPLRFTVDGEVPRVDDVFLTGVSDFSIITDTSYYDSGIASILCYKMPLLPPDLRKINISLKIDPVAYERSVEAEVIFLSYEVYPMFVRKNLEGFTPWFGINVQEFPASYVTDSLPAPASKIIKTADLDLDNNIDLVFATTYDSTLSVAYGDGEGNYTAPMDMISHRNPTGIAFGFIDNDNLLDIVAVDSGRYFVLLNQGNRSTFLVDNYPYSSGTSSNVTETGYFNDDVFVDFVTTPKTVFYGTGAGDFIPHGNLPIDFRSVAVGDFNNDGFDDLLLTDLNDSVAIYLNDGSGDFNRSLSLPVDPVSWDSKTGDVLSDFNRDGNLDFAVLMPALQKRDWGTNIYIAMGDGAGLVWGIDTITIEGYATHLEAADVNRDNKVDLLTGTTDHKLHFLFNNGFGQFTLQEPLDLGNGVITDPLVYNDFDRDGNPDIMGSTETEDVWTVAYSDNPGAPIIFDEMVVIGYDNASIEIVNPERYILSQDYQTISGAGYFRLDADGDEYLDDMTQDFNLEEGEYKIILKPQAGVDPGVVFCSGIRINGTNNCCSFYNYAWSDVKKKYEPYTSDSIVFYYTVEAVSSIYPANGMKTNTQPVFDWHTLSDSIFNSPDSFNFQLDYYYDFRSPRFDTVVTLDEGFYLSEPLGHDTVFYWRVQAFEGSTGSDFSRTFAIFVTDGCCVYYRGNVDCSSAEDPDISDITRLIDFLYISHGPLCCMEEADVDGSGGEPDISDITRLIDHLYISHSGLPMCP